MKKNTRTIQGSVKNLRNNVNKEVAHTGNALSHATQGIKARVMSRPITVGVVAATACAIGAGLAMTHWMSHKSNVETAQ